MKRVLITGASGMVGKGVLLECLDSDEIEEVVVLLRSPLEIEHPKLTEILHKDFLNYSKIEDQLTKMDACYFCLGVSAAGLKEVEYQRITHGFTLSLAKLLHSINPKMTFIYVSGEGTDSSEKGRMMWARIKGKTENELLKMGFKQAFMFRPGIIVPLRGIRSKTPGYQFFYTYFGWLFRFLKRIFPRSINTTTEIGEAMIAATRKGYSKEILHPGDIVTLALTKYPLNL